MKALLEFDLSDPDERDEHSLLLSAPDLREVLRQLGDEMRALLKYDDESYSEAYLEATENWRDRLYQLCDNWEVSPWD